MRPPVSRIVLFAPNWLGDAVMSLPAVADVRRAVPDAALVIAAQPSVAPLFGLVPGIDETVVLSKKRRPALGVENGVRPFYDAAILFPNAFSAALGAWRAGIAERWGYGTDWRRPLLTRAIEPPEGVHQVEYYQRLVAALGFPNASPFPGLPHISLSNEWREAGVRELRGAGWDGVRPLVALAPGAAYGGAKRWPPVSFAQLARTLEDDGVQTLLVGSRADLPVARAIERALDGRPILNLMATDLPTLAATLCACRALVSNDSGAMHLAAAVGVRVTAVFGPTDERLTRPAGDGHTVLSHPVWCRPCMMRECPIDHRCMRGVGVDRVVGAVRQML
jgi:lipopolysaccharide heptosyltransferase II